MVEYRRNAVNDHLVLLDWLFTISWIFRVKLSIYRILKDTLYYPMINIYMVKKQTWPLSWQNRSYKINLQLSQSMSIKFTCLYKYHIPVSITYFHSAHWNQLTRTVQVNKLNQCSRVVYIRGNLYLQTTQILELKLFYYWEFLSRALFIDTNNYLSSAYTV